MALSIVPAYAAILALIYVFLSLRVVRGRARGKIALGAGGDAALERAIRVHGNFAEYVPLSLLLIAFVELSGNSHWLVHLLCLGLVVGRAAHAYGVSQVNENLRFRMVGMVTTFAVLVTASLVLLVGAL